MLTFKIDGTSLTVSPTTAVVAGWTGRDRAGVEHHIAELEAIGVARPSTVPLYYRVAGALLTQADTIEAAGADTSGEAEPVLIQTAGGLILTLGSDHTDRALEAHSVALSKQICAKPVAREAWHLEDVADHLDALELRSWIDRGNGREPYQDGTLAAITPLPTLLEGATAATGGDREEGFAMLCGTLPTVTGEVVSAATFCAELHDPVKARTIALSYRTLSLPIVS